VIIRRSQRGRWATAAGVEPALEHNRHTSHVVDADQ
jgi:hypothetical protein